MIRRASVASGTGAQLPDAGERLIRPTDPAQVCRHDKTRCVASGTGAQLPDAV